MDVDTLLKFVALIIGFYMAWNIGANDVSNAMGTSVGSGALTLRRAVMIAAVLEFAGAYFVGGNVSSTMQSQLIDISLFASEPRTLIYGMCGALLGTGIWLQIASFLGLPVSTTHAIIGAILGFGGISLGLSGIDWGSIGSISLSWVVSPLLSGLISYILFSLLQHKILFAAHPAAATRKWIPPLLFFVFATFSLSLIFNGLGRIDLHLSFPHALLVSAACGGIASSIGWIAIRHLPKLHETYKFSATHPYSLMSLEKAIRHLCRIQIGGSDPLHEKLHTSLANLEELKQDLQKKAPCTQATSEYDSVERAFGSMQIISACFVAFSHGANDVANAIAPISTVFTVINGNLLSAPSNVSSWLLAFGGLGIVIGLATWGWRVIATIGKKITELTPTRGFSAEFGAALTILLASKIGFPISTTHCLVGAVLGVGFARGIRALNLGTIREIVLSWIITIPASALMGIVCYYLLRTLLG